MNARAVLIEPRLRVLLVSSPGGVFRDVMSLQPWWSRHERAWAVVRASDTESLLLTGERVYWVEERSLSQPLGVVPSAVGALRILRGERPSLVVSAGSGPAVGFFLVARLLGIATLWLSTLNVVQTPGVTARICSRLASIVLLQQPALLDAHKRGIVVGELY
jgi:UDP-N-acetylglucosamine:LPS N-acetylglucosamine transferase